MATGVGHPLPAPDGPAPRVREGLGLLAAGKSASPTRVRSRSCGLGPLCLSAVVSGLPCGFELAVSLGPDLGRPAVEEIVRGNVADGAVQAYLVVVVDEA